MRYLLTTCLFLAVALHGGRDASAQPYLLPFAGYGFGAGYDNAASYLARDTDDLDATGGVTLGLGLEVHVGWDRLPFILLVRPSVGTAFVPGETVTFEDGESLDFSQQLWQAGLSLIGEVPVGRAPVTPYLGFGLSYVRYSADFDVSGGAVVEGSASVSAWAIAPDLVAGLRYGRGRVTPVVEARYRFATPSPDFSAERPGTDLDNGLAVVIGARIAL
jgi:hypothetical protein